MGLIYSITAAVLVWIVIWALGMKSFDALMIAMAIVVLATAIWKVVSYFPTRGGDGTAPGA